MSLKRCWGAMLSQVSVSHMGCTTEWAQDKNTGALGPLVLGDAKWEKNGIEREVGRYLLTWGSLKVGGAGGWTASKYMDGVLLMGHSWGQEALTTQFSCLACGLVPSFSLRKLLLFGSEKGSDSADPQSLVAKNLTKRRSERANCAATIENSLAVPQKP